MVFYYFHINEVSESVTLTSYRLMSQRIDFSISKRSDLSVLYNHNAFKVYAYYL